MNKKFFLFLPFLIIFFFIFKYFYEYRNYLTVQYAIQYLDVFNQIIEQKYLLSLIVYTCLYILMTMTNLPLAFISSLIGGLLFGTIIGGMISTLGATLGATIVFIVVKYFFYNFFNTKIFKYLEKFNKQYKNNEFLFLIILRLIPGPPFALQNLIAACFGASNSKFILSTFFGIMPMTLIISNIGSNVKKILDSGQQIGPHLLLKPEYIIPILLLIGFITLGLFLKNKIK